MKEKDDRGRRAIFAGGWEAQCQVQRVDWLGLWSKPLAGARLSSACSAGKESGRIGKSVGVLLVLFIGLQMAWRPGVGVVKLLTYRRISMCS